MLNLMNFNYLSIASKRLTQLEQYACKKLGFHSLMILLCMTYQITIYFLDENYVVIMEAYLYMCTTSRVLYKINTILAIHKALYNCKCLWATL